MTKWECNRGMNRRCGEPCYIEYPGPRPDSCLYQDERAPDWKRVDEPEAPLAGCPPFTRDNPPIGAFSKEMTTNLLDYHTSAIDEMTRELTELRERIDVLEKTATKGNPNTALAWATKYHAMEKRVDVLEHQMRKHYHSGDVWVESEDGSESVMQ